MSPPREYQRRPPGLLAFLDDNLTYYQYEQDMWDDELWSQPPNRRKPSSVRRRRRRRRAAATSSSHHDLESSIDDQDPTERPPPNVQTVPLETVLQNGTTACKVVLLFLFDSRHPNCVDYRDGLLRVLSSPKSATNKTVTTAADASEEKQNDGRAAQEDPESLSSPWQGNNNNNNNEHHGIICIAMSQSSPAGRQQSTSMQRDDDDLLRGTGFFLASYTPALRATLAWSKVPSLAVIPVVTTTTTTTTPDSSGDATATAGATTPPSVVRGRNVASPYEEMILLSENLDADQVRQAWLRGESAMGLPQQAAAHLMFSCNIQ